MSLNQPVGVPYQNPLDYTGPSMNLVPIIRFPRQPLTTDKKYRVGQTAILGKNPSTGSEGEFWFLSKFESNGDATWLQLATGASSPGIDFLQTDDGAPAVGPNGSGVVGILGGTGIVTSGQDPSTDVTIAVDGSVITTQYDGDSGSATPTAGILNIVGGTGIVTSAATNIVTITSNGAGFPWTDEGSGITLSSNNGYFVTAAVTETLPASPSQGDVVKIICADAGPVVITANTGQTINLGASSSSSGGTATNTDLGDALDLVYRSSTTTWFALNAVGSWTLA